MEKYETLIFNDEVLSKLYNNCPDEIKKKLVIKRVHSNSVLIKKGSEVNTVYILVSGQFDVFKMDDKDNTLTYLSNSPPCLAGVLEILSEGKIANATVRTGKESVVIVIDGLDFKNWIENDFESYKMVCTLFVKDMYHTLNDYEPEEKPSGKNLIMQYLSCNYRDEIMQKNEISIEFSPDSFSTILNMDIESLDSSITMLIDDKLITIDNGKLTISVQQLGRIESFLLHNNVSYRF